MFRQCCRCCFGSCYCCCFIVFDDVDRTRRIHPCLTPGRTEERFRPHLATLSLSCYIHPSFMATSVSKSRCKTSKRVNLRVNKGVVINMLFGKNYFFIEIPKRHSVSLVLTYLLHKIHKGLGRKLK